MRNALELFDPLVARWFQERYPSATDIQSRAWQAISRNRHVLMSAPTGSGKTMAAFLWSLNQLICGQWSPGRTRVLYVSPLKALNNDIRRNLLEPMAALKDLFENTGRPFPPIQVSTRSGDTTSAERRRMLRQPPEILITTPESLNLLLSSAGGRSILTGIKTVILDEVHSIIDSRRGTFLMTAVERLVLLSGEFQRIALSATIHPMELAAAFVGGYQLKGDPSAPQYSPRRVHTVSSPMSKSYDLSVIMPEAPESGGDPKKFWKTYADRFRERIRNNRSTLIFTNNRALCEKLTYLINFSTGRGMEDNQSGLSAYSHHGSLSREIRTEVEQHLKAGRLKAIVATSSLELGIDIGALDEVILVQSPPSVSAAIQRIGRAGHGVGECSRGVFFPSHGMDIVNCAVLAQAVREESIENARPPAAPLDVLAQVLLSMVGFETWRPADLYNQIRTATAYRQLSRRRFDLVLNMLEGRFDQSRLRELSPRMTHDRVAGLVKAKKGALLTLYASGGVIPDRGYYGLRHSDTGARIGELDEEFVWEARVGQVFTLGTQNWRIHKITTSDVLVVPAPKAKPAPPFWKAEHMDRSFHLSERIGGFLEHAETCLGGPKKPSSEFQHELCTHYGLDDHAAERLISFLLSQRRQTGCALPHRHHIVVETTVMGAGKAPGRQVVVHNFWGGRANRPLAVAMEAAWEERYGSRAEIFATNDGIALLLPHEIPADELLGLVRAGTIESLLGRRLAQTGFFGARFRECAGRALLLPRRTINQRMPLWLSRLKAQKLLAAVEGQAEFPILVETWRTCLQDEFELPVLKQLLLELESGEIAWTPVRTAFPSPMASSGAWQHINHYMYQPDQPAAPGGGAISPDLYAEVAQEPGLRPGIPRRIVTQFALKSRRLAPGYAPDNPDDLLDWVKERLLIPPSEWQGLLDAVHENTRDLEASLADKLVTIRFGRTGATSGVTHNVFLIAARESLPRLHSGFFIHCRPSPDIHLLSGRAVDHAGYTASPDVKNEEEGRLDQDAALTPAAGLLGEWLRFYGPLTMDFISRTLAMNLDQLHPLVDELLESQDIIQGRLIRDEDVDQICDRENFEILLRLTRASADPGFQTLDISRFPLFLAHYQGLTRASHPDRQLMETLTPLLGWPAPAGLWETDILPARCAGYTSDGLDRLIQQDELCWMGQPGRKVLFSFEHELDLIRAENLISDGSPQLPDLDQLFPDPSGRYPFSVLQRTTGLNSRDLNQHLWQAVWQGTVTNDSLTALRHGLAHQFKMPDAPSSAGHHRHRRPGPGRRTFERWQKSRPPGNWFRIIPPEEPLDGLEKEERNKDRVRLLLDRYGIVFRELLARELPQFQWGALFRSLRLMELSGEVIAGHFFSHIPGLQFIAPDALQILREPLPENAVFWLNAADPASLCGIGIDALRTPLPRRIPGNHLVYHGSRLVVISRGNGRHLNIEAPADTSDIKTYFNFLVHMLARPAAPASHIVVETINDQPADEKTPYAGPLKELFDIVPDPKGLTLYRRHT